jgi:hypothetical protein
MSRALLFAFVLPAALGYAQDRSAESAVQEAPVPAPGSEVPA